MLFISNIFLIVNTFIPVSFSWVEVLTKLIFDIVS